MSDASAAAHGRRGFAASEGAAVSAVQPVGERGSLKWIQRAVAERWPTLEQPLLARLGCGPDALHWRSPVVADGFAEYRDAAFLALLGLDHLTDALASFWPRSGPRWDALAVTDAGQVVLVEAKAHIAEFCTPGTGAGPQSRAIIAERLNEVAEDLGSKHGARWPDQFYQLANRLAHLWFLRQHGVDAYLLLVGFLDDGDMRGPHSPEAWQAAYEIAAYVLGLPRRHALSPFIVHGHPSVAPHA